MWVQQYRNLKKVRKLGKRGQLIRIRMVTGRGLVTACALCHCVPTSPGPDTGSRHVIVNLLQDPGTRPVASRYLPTLLRNAMMWILDTGDASSDNLLSASEIEERYLLPKD